MRHCPHPYIKIQRDQKRAAKLLCLRDTPTTEKKKTFLKTTPATAFTRNHQPNTKTNHYMHHSA